MPRASHFFALACVALSAAAPALAQTPQSQRPYQGLFASGGDNAAESLTVNGSVGAGWDSNIALEIDDETGLPPTDIFSGNLKGAGYSLFSGALIYANNQQRTQFGASAATSGRYYSSLSNPFLAAHSASVGLSRQLGRSTSVNLNQGLVYQPFGFLNLFPGMQASPFQGPGLIPIQVASAPALDLRANNRDLWMSNTNAGITHQLGRRSSVSGLYAYQHARFGGGGGTFTFQNVGGRYNRSVTQNLGVRLGYFYGNGAFAGVDNTFRNHQIDAGVDYNRVLSFSRRTSLGFDTGGTILNNGTTSFFTVIGGAQLVHEIGRSWMLAGTFRRNVQFMPTLNEPFLQDAATAVLNGLVSRRVQVSASAGTARGTMGFASANTMVSYFGATGVNVAMTRHLAIGSAYNYFRFRLDGSGFNQLGFANDLSRNSISVFLTAWAPIYQKGQRTNASR